MTDPEPVEENKLERIEYMLNEQILDWNSPKPLESIDSAKNYAKLMPAIKTLLAEEYSRGRRETLPKLGSMIDHEGNEYRCYGPYEGVGLMLEHGVVVGLVKKRPRKD